MTDLIRAADVDIKFEEQISEEMNYALDEVQRANNLIQQCIGIQKLLKTFKQDNQPISEKAQELIDEKRNEMVIALDNCLRALRQELANIKSS